jgi:5-aminopentanamidase
MFAIGAPLRLALLHLAPRLGDLDGNRDLLMRATRVAAHAGADWVLSGELVTSGYLFAPVLGTEWIRSQPDDWMLHYAELTASLGVAAFVHAPDLDAAGADMFSSLIAFDRTGRIVGRHRKISVIPGAEDWTTPGTAADVVAIDGIRVGMLVCADAYLTEPARLLQHAGADLVVSAAAWHMGEWGPNGEWEQRSEETGLPVVVCNRTGVEGAMSFEAAESVVAYRGRRELTFSAPSSTVFLVEIERDGAGFHFRELAALPV